VALRLSARSPASRRLAEGRRYGEGRPRRRGNPMRLLHFLPTGRQVFAITPWEYQLIYGVHY